MAKEISRVKRESEMYQKMLCGAMGGSTDEEQKKNMSNIIRNITLRVVIEKCGQSVGKVCPKCGIHVERWWQKCGIQWYKGGV